MRGRRRKPNELHELNGNPSKINLKDRKAKTMRVKKGIPKPSTYLHKIAVEKFKEIIKELQNTGVLSTIDGPALDTCTQVYSMMIRSAIKINESDNLTYETKTGSRQQIPEVGMYNRSAMIFSTYMSKFGLSPSDRARIEFPDVPVPGAVKKTKDKKTAGSLIDDELENLELKPLSPTKHHGQDNKFN